MATARERERERGYRERSLRQARGLIWQTSSRSQPNCTLGRATFAPRPNSSAPLDPGGRLFSVFCWLPARAWARAPPEQRLTGKRASLLRASEAQGFSQAKKTVGDETELVRVPIEGKVYCFFVSSLSSSSSSFSLGNRWPFAGGPWQFDGS